MDLTTHQNFDDNGIRFEHGEDGGSVELSYAEIRSLGTIQCPTCGIVLATHALLVESMDQGITKCSGS